jgi:crossover junction endodeoxyribonuclease RuvC
MRILGIDPGLLRLGWGVVVLDTELLLGTFGIIETPRAPEASFNDYIDAGIEQLIVAFPRVLQLTQPDLIASEYVPPGMQGSSSETNIVALTVCKTIASQWGIEWTQFGANSIKKQVAGDGRASKAKVRNAVLAQFPTLAEQHKLTKKEQKQAGMKRPPGIPQDAFDAIAAALTGHKNFEPVIDTGGDL